MGDYLELLPSYYFEDDDFVMITVHPHDGAPYPVPQVTGSPIRDHGVWFLPCHRDGSPGTVVIPASEVRYFLVTTATDFFNRGVNNSRPIDSTHATNDAENLSNEH